jgi:hypothetical protein
LQNYPISTTIISMAKLLAGLYIIIASLFGSIASLTIVYALQSSNYQFNETSLGGIGLSQQGSASYRALSSGGILGFDNSAGTTMQFNNGHETTNDPALAFAVDISSVNFGSFSPTAAVTTTSTFEVADYTSWGYIVQIIGNAPSNGAHTIDSMTTTGVSTVGIEQFGINLVANTSPNSVGANVNHGQFGFGDPTSNYNTTNNYRFVSGETIVSAPKSSGTSLYTISYLINVSGLTQGGSYTSNQTILCTATF